MTWLGQTTPFVQQMEAVECGAACLTMVLRHFGCHVELTEIREACGVSRDGVSAKNVVRVAREYGLETRARKLEPAELSDLKGPAIIHWEMNHFVLLERWASDEVRLLDPAVGPRKVSAADFDRSFTGICIELEPGEGFEKRPPGRMSLGRYLAFLRRARLPLGVIALASVMINVLSLSVPIATQLVVDRVIDGGQLGWLDIVAACAFAMIGLGLGVALLRAWLLSALRLHLDAAITISLVKHLLSLPLRFFMQRHTGDLVGRIGSTKKLREILAGQSLTLLVDGVLLLSYLALMLAYDVSLGLVVCAAVAVYGGLFGAARPEQLARYRERVIKDVKQDVQLLQTIQGILTLKGAGRESVAHARWLHMFVSALNASVREITLAESVSVALWAIKALVPAVTLTWGASRVIDGDLTLGVLLGLMLLQASVLGPLETIVLTLLRIQQLPVHLARTDDVLTTVPEKSGATKAPRIEGAIELENVTFRYGPSAPKVLDGVSFSVARGEKVALVGPSGSGKSTVARLLLGMFSPAEGTIVIDGQPLADLDIDSVRRQIGAVLQETTLFEGTIRENVALYDPVARIEDVVAACRVALIHDDIDALPSGYDTEIGPSSGPLSGGQRQRLALARAVLHRPQILVLDEATSALDSVTEAAVERYLATRSCTRLVIAHRLSTVRDADRILVLRGGRIVEQGRHEQLMAEDGVYAELVAKGDQRTLPRVEEHGSERVGGKDLAHFSMLASLGEDDLRSLGATLVRVKLAPGDAMMLQGARGAGLYLVEDGELEIVIEEPGLQPLKVDEVGPGTVLGEVSLLDGSPASATVRAIGAVVALHLPLAAFERLRDNKDVLALRLILALGRLVAQRIRESTDRRKQIGHSGMHGEADGGKDQDDVASKANDGDSDYSGSRKVRAMRLADTALGGSLTEHELEEVGRLGAERWLERGEVLFDKGDPGDKSYIVLSGRIAVTLSGVEGYLNVIKRGELFGEVGAFDRGDRTAGCTAIERSKVFSIDHAQLLSLLEGGSGVAWKVLRHLTHNLVRVLRISTLRLREAIALKGGEQEGALRAREQARELARSRDLSLMAEWAGDRIPVVEHPDAALSGAACVAAVMRFYGRAVPFVTVTEACSDNANITGASLARGARSFGMLARRLALDANDFRFMDAPLILRDAEQNYVVAERWKRGRLDVMDPQRGRRSVEPAELAQRYAGDSFEIRRDVSAEKMLTLEERLRQAIGERAPALVTMLGGSLVLQLATLAVPVALSLIIGAALPSGDRNMVTLVALSLLAVVSFQALSAWERSRALSYLRFHLDRELLDQLMRHVLRLPIAYFERHSAAHTLQRFESFRVLRDLVGHEGVRAALDLPTLLISLVFVAVLDAPLLLPALAGLAAITIALALGLPRLRAHAAEELEAGSRARGRLIEAVAGVATLRVCGEQERATERWLPWFSRELAAGVRQDAVLLSLLALLDAVRFTTLTLVLWWGATRVLDGSLGLGALMAASGAIATLLAAVERIAGQLIALTRARERIAQVRATFAEKPEQLREAMAPPGRLRGRIALENVSFAYEPGGPQVVRDVSLDIEPGTKVAIVGASGSGKSTLGKLLLGFYLPSGGRVLFDGKDLSGLDLAALRAQIGVVLQDSFLFAGTVRENLSINAPGAELEPLIEASRRAAIHADLAALPMQYDTLVSEGGSSFSGGQRQRLALARALVHEPAILLLDEATSALDNASQAAVESNLALLSSTRIVIAHRLSTVVDADKVVVMEAGRIVEQGTHEEMVAAKGRYWQLVQAQLA